MIERVFVFQESPDSKKSAGRNRALKYAIPESKIVEIRSQYGSENCYLVINGIEVYGSFDDFVKLLGERVNFES